MSVAEKNSAATQRAGALAHIASLLAEFDVDPAGISQEIGLNIAEITSDTILPFSAALDLLECASARTGCPHFGLLLGARYAWQSHGEIQRLGSLAPTLRQALLDFVAHQGMYSSGSVAYLNKTGKDFTLGCGLIDRTRDASRIIYDLYAAVGLNFVKALTNGRVEPVEIHFCTRKPEDVLPYTKFFGVPLKFNMSQFGLLLAGATIDTPLTGFDPELRRRVEIEIAARGAALPWAARVRRAVRPQLMRDDPSLAGCASALAIHPRTLRRKLAAEGLTFEQVRDQVRFVMATELLELTDMTAGEISAAMSFATHAAFVRAFTRWSGMTPTAWRRRPSSHG
jgi:AraC-like DNA-binding protein